MAVSTKSKAKLGAKTAKTAAKNPRVVRAALPVARFAFRVGKPVAKRKVRQRVQRIGTTARTAGEWIVGSDRSPPRRRVWSSRRSADTRRARPAGGDPRCDRDVLPARRRSSAGPQPRSVEPRPGPACRVTRGKNRRPAAAKGVWNRIVGRRVPIRAGSGDPAGEQGRWLRMACAVALTAGFELELAGSLGTVDRASAPRPDRDADARAWLQALRGEGAERERAATRLHSLLLRAARFEPARAGVRCSTASPGRRLRIWRYRAPMMR